MQKVLLSKGAQTKAAQGTMDSAMEGRFCSGTCQLSHLHITLRRGKKFLRVLVHHDRLKPYHTHPDNLQPHDGPRREEGGEELDIGPLPVSHNAVQPDLTNQLLVDESDSDSDLSSNEEEPDLEGPNRGANAGPVPIVNEYTTNSGRKVRKPQRLIADPNFLGRR